MDTDIVGQTYLKIAGIDFRTTLSSNHASPSGALPFLLPAESQDPVAGSKIRKWSAAQKLARKTEEAGDVRYEAYASLLESSVRKAWVGHCRIILPAKCFKQLTNVVFTALPTLSHPRQLPSPPHPLYCTLLCQPLRSIDHIPLPSLRSRD